MSPREPDPIARAAIAEAHLERFAMALGLAKTADVTDVTVELLRRQRHLEEVEAQLRERNDQIAALVGAGDEQQALLVEEQHARHGLANRVIYLENRAQTAEVRLHDRAADCERAEAERAAALWIVILYRKHLERFRFRVRRLREELKVEQHRVELWRQKALDLSFQLGERT